MVERGGEMVSIKLEITARKKFNRLCEGEIFLNREGPAACLWIHFSAYTEKQREDESSS